MDYQPCQSPQDKNTDRCIANWILSSSETILNFPVKSFSYNLDLAIHFVFSEFKFATPPLPPPPPAQFPYKHCNFWFFYLTKWNQKLAWHRDSIFVLNYSAASSAFL